MAAEPLPRHLVLASTVLILINALAGRLWCGFACPQTVWTDSFLLVEPDRDEVVLTARDESGAVLSAEDRFHER